MVRKSFVRKLSNELCFDCVQYKGVFSADNLIGLWDRVGAEERARYPFALHQINWEEYLWKVHLPGIRK